MFSSVDTYLINRAQWGLRQIELFTPLTRYIICYTLLAINLVIGFCVFLVTCTLGAVSFSWLMSSHKSLWVCILSTFYMFILCMDHSVTYVTTTKHLKKKEVHSTLPSEIVIRKVKRAYAWINVFVTTFVATGVIPIVAETSGTVAIFTLIILCGGAFTSILLEYLFCTTSLPPGEKESRKKHHLQMSPT